MSKLEFVYSVIFYWIRTGIRIEWVIVQEERNKSGLFNELKPIIHFQNVDGRQPNDESAGMNEDGSVINSPYDEMPSPMARSPNPNNPMEYCSVIPPHQQVTSSGSAPISVMVPVGVLKREGVAPKSQRKEKNVMFSDGIRPGCDLTDLDNSWDARPNGRNGTHSLHFNT